MMFLLAVMHWQQSMWPGWTSKFFALSCCAILRVILFDPWVFCLWIFNIMQHLVACHSKTLPSVCSWCRQILIFSPWSQQTCLTQINSLSVFTVVDQLLQPTRSGVMEFVTWFLQQFSKAAHVCFLCHCISTLKEKEFHKIRNEYLI